jgi:hypothetical protein
LALCLRWIGGLARACHADPPDAFRLSRIRGRRWIPRVALAEAIWPHLVAATWGVLLIGFHLSCPLTIVENWARRHADEGVDAGFVNHYVKGVIYPAHHTNLARLACALVVLTSWLVVGRRYVRKG